MNNFYKKTFTLDKNTINDLRLIAERKQVSCSAVARWILQDGLKFHKSQLGL